MDKTQHRYDCNKTILNNNHIDKHNAQTGVNECMLLTKEN